MDMILGIDEVGRGPWAGPLVVGAVVLGDTHIEGLTDSKKLSKKRREALDTSIRAHAPGYGLGWVSARELDEIGLSEALRVATIRAVEHITVPYHEIIIDGTINFLKGTTKGRYVTTMPKADLLIQSVSAASIIAKVARDEYMAEQDVVHPGYNFASHVGYGTAAHRRAITELGVSPLHRLSFAPLKKYKTELTTKQIGDIAETLVADKLVSSGHTILDRNWKTRFCEIDIVSLCAGVVYFTEVKYRKTKMQGGGIAAVTQKKQQQMSFAAESYAVMYRLKDVGLQLQVAAVHGTPPKIEQLLQIE